MNPWPEVELKYQSVVLFVSILGLSILGACRGDKGDDVRPAPVEGFAALPEGALIESLTLESGQLPAGLDTYTFSSAELLLRGVWVRSSNGSSVRAESEIAVNDLEKALVEQNVQNLRVTDIDQVKCLQGTLGEKRVLSVTYTAAGESKSLKIPTVAASAYTCGDFAMPDATFDLILNAIKGKLPAPADLSEYEEI